MRKTYVLANSLTSGGSERQVIILYNLLKRASLILLDNEIYYDVDFRDKIKILSKHGEDSSAIRKTISFLISLLKLTKNVEKESVVISFLVRANIANVIMYLFKRNKVILTEGSQLSKGLNGKLRSLKVMIIKYFYKKADVIIVNSKGVKKDLNENFDIPLSLIRVVYNPIEIHEIMRKSREPIGQEYNTIFMNPVLATMGRLTKAKGQWHLIRIFRKIKEENPDLKLIIISDGELRNYLVDEARRLGLSVFSVWEKNEISENYDIYFLGFVKNPFKYIAKSKLFVFTSLWEGLPYTLLEAMICKVAIVSSDCRSGPREILAPKSKYEFEADQAEYSEYGILMPVCDGRMDHEDNVLSKEEEIWANALKNLIDDSSVLEKYMDLGEERVKEFSDKSIYESWRNILDEFCSA